MRSVHRGNPEDAARCRIAVQDLTRHRGQQDPRHILLEESLIEPIAFLQSLGQRAIGVRLFRHGR